MRERVASLDGSLEIGPRATGGFRVRVRLPLARRPGDEDKAETSATLVRAREPVESGR
jgi:signal transduction histidine kinase